MPRKFVTVTSLLRRASCQNDGGGLAALDWIQRSFLARAKSSGVTYPYAQSASWMNVSASSAVLNTSTTAPGTAFLISSGHSSWYSGGRIAILNGITGGLVSGALYVHGGPACPGEAQ